MDSDTVFHHLRLKTVLSKAKEDEYIHLIDAIITLKHKQNYTM